MRGKRVVFHRTAATHPSSLRCIVLFSTSPRNLFADQNRFLGKPSVKDCAQKPQDPPTGIIVARDEPSLLGAMGNESTP